MCERLGLPQEETDAIVIAAYLHDLGKTSQLHLTALNVAQYENHRAQAKKSYLTPMRLFEAVRLPDKVTSVLAHLYERLDGQGFPDRLSAKEIPLGSRLVAVAETYADLTGQAANAYRRKLSPEEAFELMNKHRGKLFDPTLLDVLKLVVLGGDLRAKLLADRRRALLIDPDAEESTVLELRLVEHGFDVVIARTSNDAENELVNEFDIVICEVELKPLDGFGLLQKIRSEGNEIPFVFLSQRDESDIAKRSFELGAGDFITKPASPDVVALKVNRVLEGGNATRKRKPGGVSGSLTEMALPDMVQILFHGRKSGLLVIHSEGKRGEIHFSEGQIFDATFGDAAREEAFYKMLRLKGGDFELDPNFRAGERKIELAPESLLLEGMRRLDEAER
jgi:response regulator RpfG family c-di-GMP phosphodiesterase